VRITVQLHQEIARELDHPNHQFSAAQTLASLLQRAGATIEPVFGGTDDSDLQTWYTVHVPEPAASDLLQRLQRHEAVLAAYIKPPESPP
jgi:hypothetical protein